MIELYEWNYHKVLLFLWVGLIVLTSGPSGGPVLAVRQQHSVELSLGSTALQMLIDLILGTFVFYSS